MRMKRLILHCVGNITICEVITPHKSGPRQTALNLGTDCVVPRSSKPEYMVICINKFFKENHEIHDRGVCATEQNKDAHRLVLEVENPSLIPGAFYQCERGDYKSVFAWFTRAKHDSRGQKYKTAILGITPDEIDGVGTTGRA